MERNYPTEQNQSRRMQPNTDRYSRWAEDDDRDDREDRFANSDREYDRFNKHTRNAPYSSYGSGHAFDTTRDQGHYSSDDRDFSQNYGRGRSFSGDQTPYQTFGRNSNFSDQARYQGQSYGGTNSFNGNSNGPSNQTYSSPNSYGSSSYSGRGYGTGYEANDNAGSAYQNRGMSRSGQYGNQSYNNSYGQNSSPSYSQGQSMSSKYGKAPKGYKRSDDRLKEEISDLLTHAHDIDPSEIEIRVSNGEVTLTGTVEDRAEKRAAEDLAISISGVSEVHNQLRLSHDKGSRYASQGSNSLSSDGKDSSSQKTSTAASQSTTGSNSASSKSVQ